MSGCSFKCSPDWNLPLTVYGGSVELHLSLLSSSPLPPPYSCLAKCDDFQYQCIWFVASGQILTEWIWMKDALFLQRCVWDEFSSPGGGGSASRQGSLDGGWRIFGRQRGAPGGCRGLPSTQAIFFHLFPLSTPAPLTAAAINAAGSEPSIPAVQKLFNHFLFPPSFFSFDSNPIQPLCSVSPDWIMKYRCVFSKHTKWPWLLPKLVPSPTQWSAQSSQLRHP